MFFAHLPRVIEHYHLFFQPSGNHTPGRLVQLVGLTHFRMVPRIYVGYSFNYVNENKYKLEPVYVQHVIAWEWFHRPA